MWVRRMLVAGLAVACGLGLMAAAALGADTASGGRSSP